MADDILTLLEFNIYADPIAAARVFALTSPNPRSTTPPASYCDLPPYPTKLSRQLRLVLYPLGKYLAITPKSNNS
jgi:hypothetical protein